jgi:hypothetical protein
MTFGRLFATMYSGYGSVHRFSADSLVDVCAMHTTTQVWIETALLRKWRMKM